MSQYGAVGISIAAGLVALYVALRIYLGVTQDPREPPMVENGVPFVTAFLGLRDNGYFLRLRARYPDLPIYTLRPLFQPKLYVVNDPHLISCIQRQHRTFTFQAIADKFSRLICDLSPAAVAVQDREAQAWIDGPMHAPSPSAATFKALGPGRCLDEMNRTMVDSLEKLLEEVVDERQEKSVQLLEWIKEVVTVSTTEGVYGPANPYRDPAVRESYWTYSANIRTMVLGPHAHRFIKPSIQARQHLGDVFEKYYSCGPPENASGLVKQRADWYLGCGFPLRDLANLEAGHGLAILSNTVPTAFWFVLHIFSSPAVLKACRDEVLSHVVHSTDPDGTRVQTLVITTLKTSCPVLVSAFKESTRIHNTGLGARAIPHDHMLDGKYLLRRGTTLLMPATVQHLSPSLWGPNAHAYQHDRFALQSNSHLSPHPRPNPISYRAFGGGATLCPGRHFATTEILALAAMLMLRFEIEPEDANGEGWTIPSTWKAGMTDVTPSPDFDIGVRIRRRGMDVRVRVVVEFEMGAQFPKSVHDSSHGAALDTYG
ncbi:cytochrome P450 [Lentithecium fluviatile CBS 122367]|uniref:Cytochrome P450 n=1 Tax=Lentithecium fluviatile CBS 122367 TaxID=1168545 RepID=A0A6G1IR87_9PLEO|nr:cytochrome P450 [Lentithecium fluviatile CBS 122367]